MPAQAIARTLLQVFVLLIIGVAMGLPGVGAAADAPSQNELDAITARGRALVAYDQAAWHSTDAVLALKPRDGAVTHYVPRRTPTGWVVAFGHLAEGGDAFIVEYEAKAKSESGPFAAAAVKPARRDTDYFLHAFAPSSWPKATSSSWTASTTSPLSRLRRATGGST